MLPLKYVSNFWRTLEMSLIYCQITLDLNWSENCVIVATIIVAQAIIFWITDTKRYVPVETLSFQDNEKLLEQLKHGFKITINWNKHQAKVSTERVNQYLDFLIDSSFQGIIRFFVLSFQKEAERTSYKRCHLPTRNLIKYNVMNRWNCFDQPIGNDLMQDDYITGCLLDYNYFKKY